jgi:hypothetical protein
MEEIVREKATHRRFRFGVLSTARIVSNALIDPATRLDVDVVAVASRDQARGQEFAAAHGIGSVSRTYAELLERDDLDAVYLPLPASYRHEWTLRALERGLHVLAEKPIAMVRPVTWSTRPKRETWSSRRAFTMCSTRCSPGGSNCCTPVPSAK